MEPSSPREVPHNLFDLRALLLRETPSVLGALAIRPGNCRAMENSDRIDHKPALLRDPLRPLVDLERVLGSDLVRDRIIAAATDRLTALMALYPFFRMFSKEQKSSNA